MNITKLSDDVIKNGIKEIWPLEENDFSPWVANNLQDIEEIIGKHIVSYELEKSCGRYEADIVATTEDGEIIIVENKLGTFDHDHFGKALTYMSYFHANTIVWICDKYYEEHIKAINQLNDMSSDEYTFYALELKLYQYDKSNIKYNYNILAEPDYVTKRINEKNSANKSINSTALANNEFYDNLINRLQTNNIKFVQGGNGKGYGWSSIKLKNNKRLSLMMNIVQKEKIIQCSFERGNDEIYDKIINIITNQYPEYEFEKVPGVRDKSILRLFCKKKVYWNDSPIEQLDNILTIFLNIYNLIIQHNEL